MISKTKLKNVKQRQTSFEVVESIYKISLSLKECDRTSDIFSYIEGLRRIFRSKYFLSNSIEIIHNIEKATSFGQIRSKMWLIEILKQKKLFSLGNIFLCAGWYGVLSFFLLQDKNFKINQLFNFEKDPLSVKVSEDLNRSFVQNNWKFKSSLKDILDLNYEKAQFNTLKVNGELQELIVFPDTIMNTSCEHIEFFPKWWDRLPQKKLIILQSNNFFQHEEHSNCVSSLSDFKKQAPMEYLYEGELKLDKYTRFMLMGYKKC